jgi:hypothetical protein
MCHWQRDFTWASNQHQEFVQEKQGTIPKTGILPTRKAIYPKKSGYECRNQTEYSKWL